MHMNAWFDPETCVYWILVFVWDLMECVTRIQFVWHCVFCRSDPLWFLINKNECNNGGQRSMNVREPRGSICFSAKNERKRLSNCMTPTILSYVCAKGVLPSECQITVFMDLLGLDISLQGKILCWTSCSHTTQQNRLHHLFHTHSHSFLLIFYQWCVSVRACVRVCVFILITCKASSSASSSSSSS